MPVSVAVSIPLPVTITVLLLFPDSHKTTDFESFEQAFSQLSSADQNYLLTVYQDDLFINE